MFYELKVFNTVLFITIINYLSNFTVKNLIYCLKLLFFYYGKTRIGYIIMIWYFGFGIILLLSIQDKTFIHLRLSNKIVKEWVSCPCNTKRGCSGQARLSCQCPTVDAKTLIGARTFIARFRIQFEFLCFLRSFAV